MTFVPSVVVRVGTRSLHLRNTLRNAAFKDVGQYAVPCFKRLVSSKGQLLSIKHWRSSQNFCFGLASQAQSYIHHAVAVGEVVVDRSAAGSSSDRLDSSTGERSDAK